LARKNSEYKTICRLIADILSFQDNRDDLKQTFSTTEVNWDLLVKVASEHLVLTTVFCRLRDVALLDEIPKDLTTYLEELTTINRNRNTTLLSEAQDISQLFRSNTINHVFLKGIALIAGNSYNDIGERMVGDIDILVEPKQLDQAFQLLNDQGYTKQLAFDYKQKNYRHLPRQVSEHRLAAVELHGEILTYKHRGLIDKETVFKTKIRSHGITIPNPYFLNLINVLTVQINDKATYFRSMAFKNAYDSLVLRLDQDKPLLKSLSGHKHGKSYLAMLSVMFPDFIPNDPALTDSFLQKYYTFKLNHPKTSFMVHQIKALYINSAERLSLFFSNKSYRNHIIKNKIFNKS